MTQLAPAAPDLRRTLRRPDDALPAASIGTVPILWNNVDIVELRLGTDAATLLDEIARTGYEGTQHGLGFPPGDELRVALAGRGLRLAEVYVSIAATVDGPTDAAAAVARERLDILVEGDGEVLCVALDGSPDRGRTAGRASATWNAGPDRCGLAAAGGPAPRPRPRDPRRRPADVAFHPHAGTYVETLQEVERLTALTDPGAGPVVPGRGHYTVGGGDPVQALRTYGERVTTSISRTWTPRSSPACAMDGRGVGRRDPGTACSRNWGPAYWTSTASSTRSSSVAIPAG